MLAFIMPEKEFGDWIVGDHYQMAEPNSALNRSTRLRFTPMSE